MTKMTSWKHRMSPRRRFLPAACLCGVAALAASAGWAQQSSTQEKSPEERSEVLTLKHAVELALRNSRELALARIQQAASEDAARVNRAEFRPNLYTGSGAAYTNGMPQTPGGAAPAVFEVSYIQALFNPPLRGQLKAAEERAAAQRYAVDEARDAVIVRAASEYLELAKVRHSLELLRAERQSAQKISDITRDRLAAGLELPIELTRAQLSAARIEQRIVQLEGRKEMLEADLRSLMGLPADQRIEAAAEEIPSGTEQPVGDLVAQAMANNPALKQAEAEQRAREHRLRGERGGYWPTLELVGQYSLLSRINNYDQFFARFQRHNVNLGVLVRLPIFSARSSANVALAQTEFNAAQISVKNRRTRLEIEVRREVRRTREMEVAREVARLELQLAQQNLGILQAQYQEGRASLRDLEKARLEEHDKWLAFLDTEYERQQARLELLRTTGQLTRVFQGGPF